MYIGKRIKSIQNNNLVKKMGFDKVDKFNKFNAVIRNKVII